MEPRRTTGGEAVRLSIPASKLSKNFSTRLRSIVDIWWYLEEAMTMTERYDNSKE